MWCYSEVMWYEGVTDDMVQPCGHVVLQWVDVVLEFDFKCLLFCNCFVLTCIIAVLYVVLTCGNVVLQWFDMVLECVDAVLLCGNVICQCGVCVLMSGDVYYNVDR